MKKLVLLALPVMTMIGCATVPTSEPMTSYQRIVDVPNVKQDMVYEGARQWVAKNFKSANSVIQYQDKTVGSIIGKGNMPYQCSGINCASGIKPSLEFTFKVDAKDNRARVTFDDLNVHYPAGYSALMGPVAESNYQIYKDEDKAKAKSVLDATINSLSSDIVKSGTIDKNW